VAWRHGLAEPPRTHPAFRTGASSTRSSVRLAAGSWTLRQTPQKSRLAWTANAWFEGADHYTHFLYAFLGDPELVIHTCTLGTTAATYPSSLGLGLTNVTVNVTIVSAGTNWRK